MTLTELLPSVAGSLHTEHDRRLWPRSTRPTGDGDLSVAGVGLSAIAARFGTPTYVLDEGEIHAAIAAFRAALPQAEIAYASKALLTKSVARWVQADGLSLDTCSAGELAVAKAVHFPGERILLHGNAKTPEDLKAALNYPGLRVVVDSLEEIDQLAALARHEQQILLRVNPGIDALTHPKIATGTANCKFGFSLHDGEAATALERILAHPNLRLVGLHCHLGSQITQVDRYESAVRFLVGVLADLRERFGLTVPQLDLGGGFAVRYQHDDPEFDLVGFADRVLVALHYECGRFRLPVPKIVLEPGRSIVARAGVTLYRVTSVRRGFVAIDGGMSDNPRPALYQASYTAHLVGRETSRHTKEFTVVGRHCESGDILGSQIELPADIHAGDLLAVPCTGAYHHPLASNYNMVGRPPLVSVHNGQSTLLLRRETDTDLQARDLG